MDHFQKNKITGQALWLCRRMVVFYLALAVLSFCLVDLYKMKVKTINHVAPQSVRPLVEYALLTKDRPKLDLERYLLYFKMASKMVPISAGDFSLLAYCYFQVGDLKRAEFCYKRAISLQPNFFWFHYNLAIIYLHKGQMDLAVTTLKKALAVSPQATLYFMQAAKAYAGMVPLAQEMGYDVQKGLLRGYAQAQAMLVMCQYNLPQVIIHDYSPRIF
jgi:tetratricopeptide (TPR) repeat protein